VLTTRQFHVYLCLPPLATCGTNSATPFFRCRCTLECPTQAYAPHSHTLRAPHSTLHTNTHAHTRTHTHTHAHTPELSLFNPRRQLSIHTRVPHRTALHSTPLHSTPLHCTPLHSTRHSSHSPNQPPTGPVNCAIPYHAKEAQNIVAFQNYLEAAEITGAVAPYVYSEASSTKVSKLLLIPTDRILIRTLHPGPISLNPNPNPQAHKPIHPRP
jgi:hypothetical protein